ncbi:MAG TPA: hypothetical protein PLF66_24055 [Leptospiraceae bacterium]|nr:hypothetical protein [Leptospiraceae bacterium]
MNIKQHKKKKIKRLIETLVFSILILVGSNRQLLSESAKQTKSIQITSVSKAIEIFRDLVLVEPINCLVAIIAKKENIICIANKAGVDSNNKMFYSNPEIVYYKLSKFADVWRVEKQAPVYKKEFFYWNSLPDFEIVTIGKKSYLFFHFLVSPMGNAVNLDELNFALFSLTDFRLTTLKYEGDPYTKNEKLFYLKGDFMNLNQLNTKPKLLKYLEKRASKSPWIYRTTKSDLEINSSTNYEKKWRIDNSSIKQVWEYKENILEQSIQITYYDKNIFPPSYQGDTPRKIENSKYKIISLFRGDILGYDKTKEKYFPIWVDSCSHGCDKDISFISEDTLKIVYSESANKEVVSIDLKKMTYSISME